MEELQNDPASFSKVNNETDPEFVRFRAEFKVENVQPKIQYILAENPHILEMYHQLGMISVHHG